MDTSNDVHALIFGPTGAVGGAAATEAVKRGAKVSLAMRDTKKTLPNSIAQLPRVQADLSDPDSVLRAVKETKANVAFVYVLFGDDMKGVFDAFKTGGIRHVVLLSSFALEHAPDAQAALSNDFISATHARVEISLTNSGLRHSIVRPRFFASNFFMSTPEFKQREIVLPPPENCTDDYIAPEDIGAVCGARLFAQSSETFALCGPQLTMQGDAWRMVAKELGITDLSIKHLDMEAWRAEKEKVMPQHIVAALYKVLVETAQDGSKPRHYETAAANLEKYLGRKPITLPEWIYKHRDELQAAAAP